MSPKIWIPFSSSVYLCTEALTGMKTYGDSRFPFDSPFTGRTFARSSKERTE